MSIEKAKLMAARAALKHVSSGQVVGLGSGSTVEIFINELAKEVRRRSLKIQVIPSSYQVLLLAYENGLEVKMPNDVEIVDVAIDGADEIDPKLNLIKGGGAALLREKIIAYMAKKYIVIADYTKLVNRLGEKRSIPVEILPFAWRWTVSHLKKYGKVEIRMAKVGKVGPVITDNGNLIADLHVKPVDAPEILEREIKRIPGVVEVGIFTGVTDIAYIGYVDGVKELAPRQ
ncbi:MAG: ribose 5-phosphate isomerase A [Candidatus Methanomethylicota archaeon]|uniref:Ribose-5-phosphate isomerase A n=1 Tax=Thermoproteota archaeon TaxID=2056631 RepID=A0A497EWA9_9CREN|nr:MAG: ribose 5-phosphate isomerase A [Candidatus Verstraetearchaeota archaeon]RLE55702.1 MAG: ribose 5-phosphate isomerase A [Candidatus Verstraetearchaeota archaeon]